MFSQFWTRRALTVLIVGSLFLLLRSQDATAEDATSDLGTPPASDDGSSFFEDESDLLEQYPVWDICVDAQAELAGFDTSNLDEERLGFGVVCGETSSIYFVSSPVGGELFIFDSHPTDADIELIRNRDSDLLERNRSWLGAWDSTGDPAFRLKSHIDLEEGKHEGLAIIDSTMSIDGSGTIRGLVGNVGDLSYRRVRVTVKVNGQKFVSDALPFELQPGETGPFELDTGLDTIPDSRRFRVRAALSSDGTRGLRSIDIAVMSQRDASASEVNEGYVIIGDVEHGLLTEFELVPAIPQTGQIVRRIRKPEVLVAAFDSEGRVVEVSHPPVLHVAEASSGRELDVLTKAGGYIGILSDPTAVSYTIWATGREKVK